MNILLVCCRHFDEAVRAFVVKRIQTWAQSTQIAAQIHSEDLAFQQRTSFHGISDHL